MRAYTAVAKALSGSPSQVKYSDGTINHLQMHNSWLHRTGEAHPYPELRMEGLRGRRTRCVDFESHTMSYKARLLHTPAMNRPKANPSSSRLQKLTEVVAGLHRLPGASNFVRPSIKTTPINRIVDTMPRSEAYERNGNGRKTVGIRLEEHSTSKRARAGGGYVHDQTEQFVSV
jgi:hypothetical protein